MKKIIYILIFLNVSLCAQSVFNRNDTYDFSGAHSVFVRDIFAGPDNIQLYLDSDHDFAQNFKIKIRKKALKLIALNGGGTWYLNRYRVDMNNDGNWELGWKSNEERIIEFDYAEPVNGIYADETIKIQLEYSNNLGQTKQTSAFITVIVYSSPAVYVDAAENVFIRIKKENYQNKKPILLVEGFDHVNTNYPSYYYTLAYDFIHDDLFPGNYAVFIINFKDGGRDMRLNAAVLLDALQDIHDLCPNYNIAVAGLSMGGVISRYTLAKAEHDGIEHYAGTFLSFDSPQQGAHISPQFQDFIRDSDPANEAIEIMQTKLNSIAAKQLLRYNTYDQSHLFFDSFFNELNSLNTDGYPHKTKNVAISNGTIQATYGGSNRGQVFMRIKLENQPFYEVAATDNDVESGSIISDITTCYNTYLFPFNTAHAQMEIIFNPVFIPTWSALDLQNFIVDQTTLNITSYDESKFDDFIIQDQPLEHHILSQKTRQKIIEWLQEGTVPIRLYNMYNGQNLVNTTLGVDGMNSSIPSGTEVLLQNQTNYKIRTNHKLISGMDIMHQKWTGRNKTHLMHKNLFTENGLSDQIASFDNFQLTEIQNDHQLTDILEFHDPWYRTQDGIQPDEFRPFSEMSPDFRYKVFKMQGGDDIHDLKPPFYQVRASVAIVSGNQIYKFSHWEAEPAGSVDFSDPLSAETPLRFNSDNSKITAVYFDQPLNLIENYTLEIPENNFFSIPAATDIYFAEGFTIRVKGRLKITGSRKQPVRISGSGMNLQYDPFNLIQNNPRFPPDQLILVSGKNASVEIENCVFENHYCPVFCDAEDSDIHIKNSEFRNCNVGILFNNLKNTSVRIDSSVFEDTDAALLMPEKFANTVQQSNFFVLHSLFINNEYGLLITPLQVLDSGLNSGLHCVLINNTFYNSKEYGVMVKAPAGNFNFGTLEFVALNNIFDSSQFNFNSWHSVYVDLYDAANLVSDCSPGSLTDYISGDPCFLDKLNNDFHLAQNSIAINNGLEAYVHDFFPDIDEDSFLYFEFEDDPDGTENIDIGAFYYPQLNGSIAADMTFEGEMQIYGELEIDPEVTVIFKEGSRIKMAPESVVSVAGELRSEGTADNKIIFMPDDPDFSGPGYWFGIHGTEGRYIHLNNTEICGAYTGVHALNTPAIIKNSLLSNNETGIRLEHSNNSVIEACQINNNYNGMDLSYSNVTVKNNIIRDNDYGIWALRVNGNFNKNQITDNNEYGLCALNQSTFQMTIENYPNTDFEINNIFENNKYASVYIDRNSEPNLGIYFEMPELITGGFNFFDPLPAGMALISENEESIIKAEVNYWDGGYQFQGMFDIHPDAIEIESHKMKKPAGVITYTDSLLNLIYIADSLFITGDHNVAVNQYHHIIAAEPDSISARIALLHLVRNVHPDSLLIHLENIINNHPATQAALTALDHCVTLLANHKNHQEALDKSTDLINMYMSDSCYTEESAFALLEQSAIQRECAASANGAQKKSYITQSDLNHNKILTEYPKTEAARYLLSRLGLPEPSEKNENLPVDFILQDCYPNPFNKTVTIPFGLKNNTDVNVKIYDILGKLVRTYEQKNMSSGWHTIKWKGKNRYGHNCASGIYLINFRAGQYRAEQKIILIK